MTTITATAQARQPARLRQLGIDTAYVLIGFPLAIIAFVLLITGFSLGLGLLVTLLGLPVLACTLYIARGLANLERLRLESVLHEPRIPATYKRPSDAASWWRKILTPLTDGQYWLDLLHGIVRFPIAVATFCVVVTWWATAVSGVLYPLYQWAIPYGPDNKDLPELIGLSDDTRTRIIFHTGLGLVFLLTLPWIVRGCALIDAWLARSLLVTLPRLRAEVAGLTTQAQTAQARTAAAVSAEATALRRLERDIHDGPQQRLVRLAVDLGRAQQQLDSDPSAARATVDEALVMTREALDELRTLSRGIAPPILTDRGLAAAAAALAARATIPVDLDLNLPSPTRFEPIAEQTAYFAIAEALTNVAKHSGATVCSVTVSYAEGRLSVVIADNGHGGANLAKGHGLAGLADRLHAAGGALTVDSPPGGPTTLTAEVPCPIVH